MDLSTKINKSVTLFYLPRQAYKDVSATKGRQLNDNAEGRTVIPKYVT